MDPAVLFQIPFGCEFLIANSALVGDLRFQMLLHVHLQTRLDVLLLAVRTLDRIALEQVEAFGVRQSNVAHQAVFVHETLATVGTALGFGVVRFPMPCDFCLRMEHFTA